MVEDDKKEIEEDEYSYPDDDILDSPAPIEEKG